jgi:hypothetical protein
MGLSAFSLEEVTQALKLTEEQKSSVKGMLEEQEKSRSGMMKNLLSGGPDFDKVLEAQKQVQKMSSEYTSKAAGMLSEEQKKRWLNLLGEPFDLDKLRPQMPKKKD